MLRPRIVRLVSVVVVATAMAACTTQPQTSSLTKDFGGSSGSQDNYSATVYNNTKYPITLFLKDTSRNAANVTIPAHGKYVAQKQSFPYETNGSDNDKAAQAVISAAGATMTEDYVHVVGTVAATPDTFKALPALTAYDVQQAQSGSSLALVDRSATSQPSPTPSASVAPAATTAATSTTTSAPTTLSFDQAFAAHKVASTISDSSGNTHEGAWAVGIDEDNGVITIKSMAGGTGKLGGTNQCTGSTDVHFAHAQGGAENSDGGCGDFPNQ